MGLLDSVIGGVLGQVLGGGRGGAMSPVVKALLMMLLTKGVGGGAGGGLGDIFGGGHGRPSPAPDAGRFDDPEPYGRGQGDLGGYNRHGEPRGAPAPLPGDDYADLSGMLDGPGGSGPGAGRETASHGASGGFDGLLDGFRRSGLGDVVESWIGHGPNRAVAPDELARALGPGTLDTLQSQTGLGRDDLLGHLAQVLPEVVSRLTPQGRVPEPAERHHW